MKVAEDTINVCLESSWCSRLLLQAIGVPGPQVEGGGAASCASAFVSYTEGAGVGGGQRGGGEVPGR